MTYLVTQETLVFRTAPGTKLTAALGPSPVAFEADGVDPLTNIAWSVIAKGPATEVEQTQEFLASSSRRLFPWESGNKDHFVRITPAVVTGRRFVVAHPQTWDISLNDATRSGLD